MQGQARRMGGSCWKTPTTWWFLGESFYRQNLGCRVCDFLLFSGEVTGQCSRNLVLSLKLPSSTWGGGLAEELKDIFMYITWGRTRTLSQGCPIVSCLLLLCFWILSFPWLTTVWICFLEFIEGQGAEWNVTSTNKKWGPERLSCPGGPGSCSVSIPLFFDTSQSWREQVLGKKGNNILGIEVNHKLSRGTQV